MPINEQQLQVVQRYLSLLETINEAFLFIKTRPLIHQVGAAEKMYPDIIRGWEKLSETHADLGSYFKEDAAVGDSIDQFNKMIEAWEVDMPRADQPEKLTHLLITNIGPNFQEWKEGMTNELQKVTLH